MALLITDNPNIWKYQLSTHLIKEIAMSLSYNMTGQAYEQVFTQLVRGYAFIIRDDRLGV